MAGNDPAFGPGLVCKITIPQPETKNISQHPRSPSFGWQGLRPKEGGRKRYWHEPACLICGLGGLAGVPPSFLAPAAELACIQGSKHTTHPVFRVHPRELGGEIISHRRPYKTRQGTGVLQRFTDQLGLSQEPEGKQGKGCFPGGSGRVCALKGLGAASPRGVASANTLRSWKFLLVQEWFAQVPLISPSLTPPTGSSCVGHTGAP